jgi:hypothetical protein
MVSARGALFAAALLCLPALPSFPELKTTAEISTIAAATSVGGAFCFSASAEGRLTFQAEASREVKGLVEIDATVTSGSLPEAVFEVPRAYLKARFPLFRLTAGKTRLSWGAGFVFDAGDVIFGGMTPYLDLTQADPRDQTAWLASAYVPLGDFSFFEAVGLPFMPPQPGDPAGTGSPYFPFDSINVGGRAVAGLKGITLEAGYLYSGQRKTHMPYMSVQTSLYFDLYAAASLGIPESAAIWDDVSGSLHVSCGLSRAFDLGGPGSLSVRAEAAVVPCGEWGEISGGLLADSPGYGALMFTDLTYAPSDAFAVSARSLLSPVDTSGLVLLEVSWQAFQGFTLLVDSLAMFGQRDDLFGWGRDADLAFLVTLKYRF